MDTAPPTPAAAPSTTTRTLWAELSATYSRRWAASKARPTGARKAASWPEGADASPPPPPATVPTTPVAGL